ncbi:MAG: galactose oxidase [Bacteroidota bacterium]
MIKKYIGVWLAILSISCSSDDDGIVEDGNWVQRADFAGENRSGAVAFVIGDQAFVGLGFDGDDYLNDFFIYSPAQNNWSSQAVTFPEVDTSTVFPGIARTGAVAFAIGEIGYVGTGFDGDDELRDFYAYDSRNNTWSQIEDFPGTPRTNAVAFVLDGLGYVGTGFDGSEVQDFFIYDPATNSWNAIVGLPRRVEQAVSMVINNEAYVVTGIDDGLNETTIFSQRGDNAWGQLNDIDDEDLAGDLEIPRNSAVSFVIGDFGFITTGIRTSNLVSTWAYEPGIDAWEERTSFEGAPRSDAISFTVNGRAFVGLGRNSSTRFDDLWEFFPDEELDEDD